MAQEEKTEQGGELGGHDAPHNYVSIFCLISEEGGTYTQGETHVQCHRLGDIRVEVW